MIRHTGPISGIATHPSGYVATAGYDNQVILWDAATGQGLSRGLHDHLANQCAFSPDGKYLVSSSSDYSARVWSVPKLRLCALLGDHEDDVEGVAFHPSRPVIATSSRDTRVRLFDLHGKCLQRMSGHAMDVISVEWLGDSETLVSTSDDGTIKLWNAFEGKHLETLDLGGVETDTITVTDTGVIFAGNDQGQIIAIERGREQRTDAHAAGIKRLIYDKTARALVSLSYDRTVKIWRVASSGALQPLQSAALPPIVWPRSCAFLDPETIVFVSFGSKYATYRFAEERWDTAGIEPSLGRNAVLDVAGSVFSVGDAGIGFRDDVPLRTLPSLCNFLVDFDGRLLTGGQTGEIFELESGQLVHRHRSPLNCATVFEHRGERRCMIGTYTGEGIVLRKQGERVVFERNVPLHQNAIKGICAEKSQIFSVCADTSAAFFDADTLEPIRTLPSGHGRIANGCAALPDGSRVSVSRDLKLRLWRTCDDVDVLDTPHQNSIKCVATSRDGRFVATGDYTGHVGVFDVAGRRWVGWHRPTAAGISSLCRKHDDQGFLASSYDGTIYPLARPSLP
jgi:WD40 repeat protein